MSLFTSLDTLEAIRLNPCFNGTYSMSISCLQDFAHADGLNPCFNGTYSMRSKAEAYDFVEYVLILVLMEHTL